MIWCHLGGRTYIDSQEGDGIIYHTVVGSVYFGKAIFLGLSYHFTILYSTVCIFLTGVNNYDIRYHDIRYHDI